MVLDVAITAGYEIVKYSWFVSTFAAPLYVASATFKAHKENEFEIDGVLDRIEQNGPKMVGSVVAAGTLLAVAQPELTPIIKNITQPIALALFGFLFYRF